ncbi:MAG: mechanosensitive ion channel protein MscL [Elusimicrobia bacterium RIFCSPLOWO2_01_FULL_54_10]|nr:MAG: mechanosensitive ion channel protein MscL [Elusimicrobia bacterium RIFCSPLOWO2_01_FULL_54_10]
MLKDFKAFALRGNVVDMAVGVIIGGAFGKIIASVVNDLLMPPIGFLVGNVDFNDLKFTLRGASEGVPAVTVNYGVFINEIINFTIIAFCMFMAIRGMTALKKEKVEPAPTEKKCPQCLMLIPIDAKRCGHCTQALA